MADLNFYENHMTKSIKFLGEQFDTIRAGRANPSVLDRIMVEYYGTPTALNAVGTISTPDPRTILIQPWDKTLLKPIEKAIQASDLGINPANDGTAIRLAFPQLTEERRKEMTKLVKKYAEEAKVAVRNIRRDAMTDFKKQEKSSEITEDDLKKLEKDLQDLTDKKVKEIDVVAEKKEKELLTV